MYIRGNNLRGVRSHAAAGEHADQTQSSTSKNECHLRPIWSHEVYEPVQQQLQEVQPTLPCAIGQIQFCSLSHQNRGRRFGIVAK